MDLAEIRSFVCVAHRLSCTQAAKELDLSQGTVSRHIQHLEDELGLRLIDRSRRLVALTSAGNRFLLWAEGVLERYQRMLHDLKHADDALSGTISLASSLAPYEFIVPRLIVSFSAIRPAIKFETTVSSSADVFCRLETAKSDIGFTGLRPPDERFHHELVALDELVLAVPSDHPLAAREEISWSNLDGVTFLMREPGSGTRLSFETAMRRHSLKPPRFRRTRVMQSTDALVSAVQDGFGVGFVSLLAIQARTPEGIRTVRIKNLRMNRSFYLVVIRDRRQEALIAAFLEWVVENRAVAVGRNYENFDAWDTKASKSVAATP